MTLVGVAQVRFLSFVTKAHYPEGPQKQGRILYFCHILKAMETGKGDALRQE